jgi:monoamine oxidase
MARVGGAGAVYETLAIWGFLKPPPAMAASFELPRDSGSGKTVAVLGAGVSGLCAAYELDRAGYDVVILEAARRAGGRSLTLRRGDVLKEMGDAPAQVCEFDKGLYLNAGPGRIPHHHVHVIDYCRQFGVALQPYIFASRANLVHTGEIGNGKTMQVRRALYDLQGHVAELLDKCSRKDDLDGAVSKDDLEAFRDMLAQFGDLTKVDDGKSPAVYRNKSGHAGFETPPGLANQPGKPLSPIALDEILRSKVWNDYIFRETDFSWQTSLMEPVGGMDNFFRGFLRQPLARQNGTIEGLIRYGAKVSGIEVAADKVTIAYHDGSERVLAADYCVSTIPMPIFKALKTNLPGVFMEAARKLPTQAAGKVGWQAARFWETEDQIYGGISWTTDDITQIWYPSYNYLSAKGTLTGAYMYGDTAERFNALPVSERLAKAKAQGERLHSNYAKYVEHGVAIGWNNMEFERFGWADEGDKDFGPNAQILNQPQGRFHMAGDQLTYWSGWQEGALIAAHAAATAISDHARANAR